MNLFKNKDSSRKIGPKLGENYKILENEFKPRLYEDQINFDRMRMYRLNRIKEQLLQNNIGACILFDPINIRYDYVIERLNILEKQVLLENCMDNNVLELDIDMEEFKRIVMNHFKPNLFAAMLSIFPA